METLELIERLGVDVDPSIAASIDRIGSDPILPTPFHVGEAAATAYGLTAATAASIGEMRGLPAQQVTVRADDAAAALLGFMFIEVDGETSDRANASNPTVAMYPTADGRWIHLHGGFEGLRLGTLEVLGLDNAADADEIAAAVLERKAWDLEDELAAAGMCGAVVRSPAEWDAHPHGQAVGALGAVELTRTGDGDPVPLTPTSGQPLEGIRVLDLARVLAAPTCARTLASHGADVLRINGPNTPDLELFTIETSHGKRSAFLDLDAGEGVEALLDLVDDCHVFIDGFRPGALERRGFGPAALAARRPGIVTASVSCYGPEGPFADRPGWEQLAQSATGIAHLQGTADRPELIPAAAADYTTGALAAWGVTEALRRQQTEGGSWHVAASLCQTTMWLRRLGSDLDPSAATDFDEALDRRVMTDSPWGQLTHLPSPVSMSSTPPRWAVPSSPPGTDEPAWCQES